MASESKKLRRSQNDGKPSPAKGRGNAVPDPLGQGQLRSLLTRLGLILAGVWVLFGSIAAVVNGSALRMGLLAVPILATGAAIALLFWTLRQAKTARGVASILSGVETAEDRKAAIEKLETGFKKNDPAAIFARAQLELQEDPRKALVTLEKIDLSKVMAPVADEARGQRAMIHLTLGEVSPARQLVDNIDMSRHQDAKTRAMLASIASEAWARSGDAKKATDTLSLFDPEDASLSQIRPQLYRATAFAAVQSGDLSTMRRALKRLLAEDVRLLGSFMMKRTHPLLQKEAKKLLEQSGQMPRKMVVQRRV